MEIILSVSFFYCFSLFLQLNLIIQEMNNIRIIVKYLLPVLVAVPILLSGCRKSEACIPDDDMYIEMMFTQENGGTRAEIGNDGSGFFTDGDKVGLYICGKQTKHIILTMEGGKWTPKLLKSELGTGTVNLSAYYPAREDVSPETNRHTHSVNTDQTGHGYEDSDLLWSHLDIKQGDLAGGVIEMPFVHGMHRLSINISTDGVSLPEDLTVTVKNIAEGSFDLSTGQIDIPAGTMKDISPRILSESEGEYSAILFPGSLEAYAEGWVEITTDGKTSVYKAPATIGESSLLESGKETVLNLHLKSNGDIDTDPDPVPNPDPAPDPDYGGRTCWVYGVKTTGLPDYPRDHEESVPEYSFLVPENFPGGMWYKVSGVMYLNWQKDFLWYDCDKDDPDDSGSRPGYRDSNMCWAAGASNLLHWWTRLNEPYIKAYDAKYSSNPWPSYPRPSFGFSDTDGSGIFDFFRDISRNRGGSDAVGVNWFICGTPGISSPDPDIDDNFGGYFTEIFDNIDVAVKPKDSMNKESLSRIIKGALENKQGLGFVQSNLSKGVTHVMTIWGVEFDDAGYVSALYYVDNNDHYNFEVKGGANKFQHHRLIRQEIKYRDGLWKVMMGNSSVHAISSITVVDLKRDVWQKEFPEVEIKEDYIQ